MKLKVSLLIVFTLSVLNIKALTPDKLSQLRTEKKIIRVEQPTAPYYSIQILALREAPREPEYFSKVNMVYEYPCSDGYVRYCVGKFNSFKAALAQLESIKALGYDQAFVVNTKRFPLKSSKWADSGNLKIYPDKTYTVQLCAFRFPVYLSYFKNLDGVMEFRMKDKIFRYTIGKFPGSVAKQELQKIKAKGYKDAFLVEYDKYAPFKIE
ncbi:MAG: SPOR domain-containing protein [Chlorobi bacterium]|nr:SPOR domain-containing protein [Chlorobiota bacterium]